MPRTDRLVRPLRRHRQEIAANSFNDWTDCRLSQAIRGGKPCTIREKVPKLPRGVAGREVWPLAATLRQADEWGQNKSVRTWANVGVRAAKYKTSQTVKPRLGQRLVVEVFGPPKFSCSATAADCRDSPHCAVRFSRARAPRTRAMQTVATVRDSNPVKRVPWIVPLLWLVMNQTHLKEIPS